MKRKSKEICLATVSDLPCDPLSFFKKTLEIKTHGIPTEWIARFKDQTAVLYFEEPSTRTRLSFEMAVQRLGMKSVVLTGKDSSRAKGETHAEFMRFVAQYQPTVVILRTSAPTLPQPSGPPTAGIPIVINAGSGQSSHPTQALLDYVTIYERLGKISPLHIGFCGDVSRSRVFRSHVQLAQLIPQVEMGVFAPFPFNDLTGMTHPCRLFKNKDEFMTFCDVICILRNQSERSSYWTTTDGTLSDFVTYYRLHAGDIPENIYVLHPGPIHFETDMDHVLLDRERSLIDTQVANGLYTRICLIGILGEKVL